MNTGQIVSSIAVMAAAVILTRSLPFLVFPSADKTPRFVRFLGRYLASAVFGMLVVYCFKDVHFVSATDGAGHLTHHGLPQLIGVALTIALHIWRRNLLFTIAGGTVLYIILLKLWGLAGGVV